jgi:hypothetical protein
MKKLFVALILSFTLASCSLIPAKFDNHEYSVYVSMYEHVLRMSENCGNTKQEASDIVELSKVINTLRIYVNHRNHDSSKEYINTVDDFVSRIKPGGIVYCKETNSNLQLILSKILTSIGSRRD